MTTPGRPPLPYQTLPTADPPRSESPHSWKNWIPFSVALSIIGVATIVLVVMLTPPTPSYQQQTPEQQYVAFAVPRLPNADETSVTNLAHTICDGRESGLTLAQEADAIQATATVSDTDAEQIANLAIAAYCPSYG